MRGHASGVPAGGGEKGERWKGKGERWRERREMEGEERDGREERECMWRRDSLFPSPRERLRAAGEGRRATWRAGVGGYSVRAIARVKECQAVELVPRRCRSQRRVNSARVEDARAVSIMRERGSGPPSAPPTPARQVARPPLPAARKGSRGEGIRQRRADSSCHWHTQSSSFTQREGASEIGEERSRTPHRSRAQRAAHAPKAGWAKTRLINTAGRARCGRCGRP